MKGEIGARKSDKKEPCLIASSVSKWFEQLSRFSLWTLRTLRGRIKPHLPARTILAEVGLSSVPQFWHQEANHRGTGIAAVCRFVILLTLDPIMGSRAVALRKNGALASNLSIGQMNTKSPYSRGAASFSGRRSLTYFHSINYKVLGSAAHRRCLPHGAADTWLSGVKLTHLRIHVGCEPKCRQPLNLNLQRLGAI